jgi:hypothetical protein
MTSKTEKSASLRADIMPRDGYMLTVDGKMKTRFETADEAMAAGLKLKTSYPVVQVAVFDAAVRSYVPVVLEQK